MLPDHLLEFFQYLLINQYLKKCLYIDIKKFIDFKKEEELTLPKNIDYKTIRSLSNEIVESLEDKIHMKEINVETKFEGFKPDKQPLIKTD